MILSGGEVVLHETRSASVPFTGVTVPEPQVGRYTIWIEDIHPGFDDERMFTVSWRDINDEVFASRVPNGYETRRYQGVDYELVAIFDIQDTSDKIFNIEHLGEGEFETGDRMHIIVVRNTDPLPAGLLGAGIILATLGVVSIAWTRWSSMSFR